MAESSKRFVCMCWRNRNLIEKDIKGLSFHGEPEVDLYKSINNQLSGYVSTLLVASCFRKGTSPGCQ